jgi:hypothetical protein
MDFVKIKYHVCLWNKSTFMSQSLVHTPPSLHGTCVLVHSIAPCQLTHLSQLPAFACALPSACSSLSLPPSNILSTHFAYPPFQ